MNISEGRTIHLERNEPIGKFDLVVTKDGQEVGRHPLERFTLGYMERPPGAVLAYRKRVAARITDILIELEPPAAISNVDIDTLWLHMKREG